MELLVFDVTYYSGLPADELQLAIVESKSLTVVSGVFVKDDFFHSYSKENHRWDDWMSSGTINKEHECNLISTCYNLKGF